MSFKAVRTLNLSAGLKFAAISMILFYGCAGQRKAEQYPPSWPKVDYRTPRYIEASQDNIPTYKNEPLPAPVRLEPTPVVGQGR